MPNSDRNALWRQVPVLGAAAAILIALMGLLGYLPGFTFLGSVREGYIPMAPSTAFSFIVLAGILLATTLRPHSGSSPVFLGPLAALVSLFGALEVIGHFLEMDLNLEDTLVPSAGYLGDIPIGRMSPATGAVFFVAGLGVLALVLRRSPTHRRRAVSLGRWGLTLGSLVVGSSLAFFMAYLLGSPLLYGQGATVPMALTTALAFLMLGVAEVQASRRDAIPGIPLDGPEHGSTPMGPRRRFVLMALVMIVASMVGLGIMATILYRYDVAANFDRLQATAQSQARLIEAVARYNSTAALVQEDSSRDGFSATLIQIEDAHERYGGFGETGEFTLARREGDSIVFLLRHRGETVERPESVSIDSELAVPMRLALSGSSGVVIGLDYRGERVMAAYEPVAVLNLGIVAKMDLSELRSPFLRAGFTAALVALLLTLAGVAIFFRIGTPLIHRLEAYAGELEEEIRERTQAEEARARLTVQLKGKNKELEQIIYVTSHDLRSPLVNIDGYSKELEFAVDTLRSAADGERTPAEALAVAVPLLDHDIPEALRFIRTSAAKMDGLLKGLLRLSRLGRTSLTVESLDMNTLMASVVAASDFQAREAGVEVEVAQLPPCSGDAVQVDQVFSNLLDNALHYLDPGRPGRIRISGRIEKDRCVFCVEDNGIGIAPAAVSTGAENGGSRAARQRGGSRFFQHVAGDSGVGGYGTPSGKRGQRGSHLGRGDDGRRRSSGAARPPTDGVQPYTAPRDERPGPEPTDHRPHDPYPTRGRRRCRPSHSGGDRPECCPGRWRSDRSDPDEPVHQRARRHVQEGHDHDHDGKRQSRQGVLRGLQLGHGGAICTPQRLRCWVGDGRGDAHKNLRSILHYEGGGRRYGTGSGDGLRVGKAAQRHRPCGQPGRPGNDHQDLAARERGGR